MGGLRVRSTHSREEAIRTVAFEPLEFGLEEIPGGLALRGEVTADVTGTLAAAVDRASEHGRRDIVLDVSGVVLCDSSGLSVLGRAARAAAEHGCRVVLLGLAGNLKRVLELTGLVQSFVVPSYIFATDQPDPDPAADQPLASIHRITPPEA